ncbi:MAG: M6 family metalloprotease domain-containing protein [Bacteroidaceae bacterium]|nr:M6 family metalloprotease domain-containing protein [Bacteroidaceae bacterium]
MKKFSFMLMAAVMSVSAPAQQIFHRGHVENTTDYSLIYSSNSLMRKIGNRASAPLPCTGSPKVPVVLVQFSDTTFHVGKTADEIKAYYDKFCNLTDGDASPSYGSVKAYFREQSYRQFTPDFQVIGPVTLSKSYSYYGKNSGNSKDVNINKFYSEACKLAISQYDVDWNSFDNDNDGVVDMVFFIYAGEGENNASLNNTNLIWPKEGTSQMKVSVDGSTITFGSYGCTCELYNGEVDGIGTMCHELSHGLGLPDLYGAKAYGMDYWDIMDTGCYQITAYCPIGYSAYEREFMGWREIITLDPNKAYSLTLEPLETTGKAYKVVNAANTNEYFILENRQNIGYDTYLGWPTPMYKKYGKIHGLLITHVDYKATVWTTNYAINETASHQRLTTVPADGEQYSYANVTSIENVADWAENTKGDLYPYTYTDENGKEVTVREMSSYAVFTGTTLGQTIDNIRESEDGIITLDINGGTVIPALKDSISDFLSQTTSLVDAKMNAKVLNALKAAISDATTAVEGKDQEELQSALAALKESISNAKASVEVYQAIARILERVQYLGDAGKESFSASGMQTKYDKGTLTSVDDVQKAYDEAQSLDNTVTQLKNNLNAVINSASGLVGQKMNAEVAKALDDALTAATNALKTNDVEALTAAHDNLRTAMNNANNSIAVYVSIASIISQSENLNEVGKKSFADSGVQEAYENGTLTSVEEVQQAYQAALQAQHDAEVGIDNVLSDSNNVKAIYGPDGSSRSQLQKGINYVIYNDGLVKKIIVSEK